jgi:hypothetical protein
MARKTRHKQVLRALALVLVLSMALLISVSLWRPTEVIAGPDNKTLLPLVLNNQSSQSEPGNQYVVLGWNDLGMHCYDFNYSTMAVLPPYNNLFAQVIKRGDPPQLVTTGINVEYGFPNNTDSASKTNFWTYAQKLFGVALSPNIGLAGKGLSGLMDPATNHFVAEGIPITEYPDGSTTPDYYQLANVVAKEQSSGKVLAQTQVVVPVSSEMRCDVCHNSPSTNFRMNILNKHDSEEGTHLAQQATSGNPVLCANCHADPALGKPGANGIPSLSAAMHNKHKEIATNCYNCHPGPQTKCLRDVMSVQFGKTCTDCHVGGMQMLSQESRTPWVDEPRCSNCHAAKYAENTGKLYKQSTGHGGLYCESCHNSTHAITPSREPNDNVQAIALQGYAGSISKCTVCHQTQPTGAFVHP